MMGVIQFWQRYFRRNGPALGLFLLLAVGFWMFLMIVLPQLFMADFSLRANVPPPQWGTEAHHLTLEHYKFMLYGSAGSRESYNVVDLTVFFRTLGAAVFVTLIDLALCYPIAYFLAQSATGAWGAPHSAASLKSSNRWV